MNTSGIVAVLAVIAILVLAALAMRPLLRRRRLRERFGPEYDRMLESHGNRAAAEHELVARERRRKELRLRPLSPQSRERYIARWAAVQVRFVDAPLNTVEDAERLVTALMTEYGYPNEGHEQRLADLSVEHPTVVEHYRAARDIHADASNGDASTEDLRKALLHYGEVFAQLVRLNGDGRDQGTGRTRQETRLGDAERDRVGRTEHAGSGAVDHDPVGRTDQDARLGEVERDHVGRAEGETRSGDGHRDQAGRHHSTR